MVVRTECPKSHGQIARDLSTFGEAIGIISPATGQHNTAPSHVDPHTTDDPRGSKRRREIVPPLNHESPSTENGRKKCAFSAGAQSADGVWSDDIKPPSVEETWSAAIVRRGTNISCPSVYGAHHSLWIFTGLGEILGTYTLVLPADITPLPRIEPRGLPSLCSPRRPFVANAPVMSNSATTLWSDNPNAPKIPCVLYLGEKAYFAGFLIGAIFYGTQTYTSVYPSSSRPFDLSL